MNKLIEISKLFEISLDELINNMQNLNSKDKYRESAVEKNNKNISIKLFIVGLIICCVLCGLGWIKQSKAIKTNKNLYNEAYALSEKNYNEV